MAEAALVIDEPLTRKSHADDPARPDLMDQPLVVGTENSNGSSPEDAVTEARRIAEAKEAENARLRADNERKDRERADALRQASEANVGRVSDREMAINSSIESAKSAEAAATSAYRAAREAGDIDAEIAAQKQLGRAQASLMAWESEKANLEQYKKSQPARTEPTVPDNQMNKPSAESQAWMDSHPRFFTDDEYQADAIAADALAVKRGIPVGSKAYVDFIDRRMEELYGPDHGRAEGTRIVTDSPRQAQRRNASSTAAPPARSGETRSGRASEFVYTDPGTNQTLRLTTVQDPKSGRPVETVVGTIPAEWVEYARIAGFSDPVAYAVEQMHVQQELKGGSLRGLDMGQSGAYQ